MAARSLSRSDLKDGQIKQCVKLIGNLYRAFTEKDMSLLEINPLIVTEKGDLVCLDAKLNFDGNALYRHPDIWVSVISTKKTRRKFWRPATIFPM